MCVEIGVEPYNACLSEIRGVPQTASNTPPRCTTPTGRLHLSCTAPVLAHSLPAVRKGIGMHLRGFVLLAVVLGLATPALAQSARDLEADRLADKLWRVIDITTAVPAHFRCMSPWKPRMANALP